MDKATRFNYIITIHNKEELIAKVLYCVLMCARDNSYIYPVLDGCTDGTEKVIDEIIDNFSGVPITKVFTNDVHELLTINAGLKASNQEGNGYNIILQDDVLLADFKLEEKVENLYEYFGEKLGYISFRLGANFQPDTLISNNPVPYQDYVENVFGHGLSVAEVIYPGQFAFRTVPIKSPVCVPFKIIREIGMYNEDLAPYGHDDPEFAIRLIKAGYKNAVFPIQFYSDVNWGGTRTSPHTEIDIIVERDMNKIRTLHRQELELICRAQQETIIINLSEKMSQKEIINSSQKEKYLANNEINRPIEIKNPHYNKFKNNIFSQNGEDGIITQLCIELNIGKGWFCEFGAWDGIYLSNCYNLLTKGWNGIMIEGDSEKYIDLLTTKSKHEGQLNVINKFVGINGQDSLDNILINTSIPRDFDLLSVGIDGADYFVWENFKLYNPKIVIIEVNSNYQPGVRIASEKGSSFSAMQSLGISKGYSLVCHTGNTIFVRNDLIHMLSLTQEFLSNPNILFDSEQFPH